MSRTVPVHNGPVTRDEPRLRPVKAKQPSDYPGVPAAYLEIAKNYANPLLLGPPLCDELVALVMHMFSEEEAELVQHIKSPLGRTASAIARAARQPLAEVRPILDRVADVKFTLMSLGSGSRKRYHMLPLIPGVFELVLVRTSLDTLNNWHRSFAELFAALYDTGFLAAYVERPIPLIRHLPVAETIEAHPMALPSDHLESVLEHYTDFAVGLCQCRVAEKMLDQGCDRPLENCVAFGDIARLAVSKGKMRQVEMKDVLTIKAEAASAGLATWVLEARAGNVQVGTSCSCCDCCCHALRVANEFNAPGLYAPPHFIPAVDLGLCIYCARCARACPMKAIIVDAQAKSFQYLTERCVGCGLCAVACDQQHAIRMEAVPEYQELAPGLLSAVVRAGPSYLSSAWEMWKSRR